MNIAREPSTDDDDDPSDDLPVAMQTLYRSIKIHSLPGLVIFARHRISRGSRKDQFCVGEHARACSSIGEDVKIWPDYS